MTLGRTAPNPEVLRRHPAYAERVPSLLAFAAAQDLHFNEPLLLFQAFVNRGFVNELVWAIPLLDNERLEYLGDAVLTKVVSERLYRDFPQCREGELTQMRAQLIRGASLSSWAKDLDLGSHLIVGKSGKQTNVQDNRKVLANTFEALVGAIQLDQGEATVVRFMERWLAPAVISLATYGLTRDAKSALQELVQATRQVRPHYDRIMAYGSGSDRKSVVQVSVQDKVVGIGRGSSMQKASFKAAEAAMALLWIRRMPPWCGARNGRLRRWLPWPSMN